MENTPQTPPAIPPLPSNIPPPQQPSVPPATSGGGKFKIILGAVVVLALIGLVWYFFLRGTPVAPEEVTQPTTPTTDIETSTDEGTTTEELGTTTEELGTTTEELGTSTLLEVTIEKGTSSPLPDYLQKIPRPKD